jgi:hypothetical protein
MKNIFVIFIVFIAACKCSGINKTTPPQTVVATDSVIKKDSIPTCIRALIKKLETEPVTNPPSKIYSYIFEGKTVYYVPAVCCDNFSDLYNDSCKIIAHPDGGFTGKGDRKAPTFQEEKKDEKLIWEDKRK